MRQSAIVTDAPLAGATIFTSGATRGIGLVALRAACQKQLSKHRVRAEQDSRRT